MPNQLENETSPYLLQHADNPVDWYPWGPEAFKLAQEQDKPIFLSIGYAACHWCHVMAHESFEDSGTAELMNTHFINIKVDREERPDVDSIYMNAVVALTGQGGWPTSVFLTSDGKPFFGGTYFPPVRRFNMPSFQEVLNHISDGWRDNRKHWIDVSERLTEQVSSQPSLAPQSDEFEVGVLDLSAEALLKSYDWENGGWGGAPKFPQATVIEHMLRRHHHKDDSLALELATHALAHMARGGIYDQVGGGFHRYAVDDLWLVPHFEKMLYDNALLVRVYLHAWQITGESAYLRIVEETLQFLLREMRHEEGGFFASLDADSEGEEGTYYVWTPAQIRDSISDSKLAEEFIVLFGVTDSGNFEGKNVLSRTSLEGPGEDRPQMNQEEINKAILELREARGFRERPAVDDKVLTAWNGLLLSALAETARATGRETYLQAATQLAEFILEHMTQKGRLTRSWRAGKSRQNAFLEDYAALGEGLLTLYQVDFNPRWYEAATAQADEILDHFSDPAGGFYDTRDDHEGLISRPKSIQDTPIPSGNSLAVNLLLKLATFTGEGRYADPAESALRAMQSTASRYPTAFSGWLNSIDFALGPQIQLAMVGDFEDTLFQQLSQVTNRRYLPHLVRAATQVEKNVKEPPLLRDRNRVDGASTAYLCQQFTCKLPTTSPEELERLIQETL